MARNFGLVAGVLALCLAGCATGTGQRMAMPSEPTMPQVRAISTYSFGDSREPLVVVEDMVAASIDSGAERAKLAAELSALLMSDATRDAKHFACRQLALIGGAENVPAIAPLLNDPRMADMARYALEPIPGREADQALINALDTAPADVKVGIINTLARRHSSRGLDAVRDYVDDANPEVAAAARDALSG